MIAAKNVTKAYGAARVVDDVTVTIPRGQVTAIIGPNGAGKSTFLGLVSRLLALDGGSCSIDEMDVRTSKSEELAKKLSILRQDNHMTARLTVRDLVSFGRYPYTKGRLNPADYAHIDRAIGYLGLDDLSDRFLDQLSGGQRQRAYAAMVLCQDTEYVLLDEPLNNLDMRHAQSMMRLMRKMCAELGKTVVVVLHDINFASWHADYIVAMKDGKLCQQGPTAEIMTTEILHSIYDMEIEIIETHGRRTALYFD